MIREARHDDIPRLLEMGEAFARDAGVTARIGWDDDSVTQMLEGLIKNDDGIVLVSDRGMIGGFVASHPFNQSTRVFTELFWRAEDGNGMALLSAAEMAAQARGATLSVMVAMSDMGRTKALYGRIGYEPLEAQFVKDLA